jgi:trehalose 6-phosphate synthase
MVSDINGKFAQTHWVPIHYVFRSVDRTELAALYRAADIALITPLKDGMNLVAKEYCACNVNEDGVLIMSEFAGAAAQLHPEAILVNPYDVEEVAGRIAASCDMPLPERRRRMKALRRKIQKTDIYWWVDSFLEAVFAHDLREFSSSEDDMPEHIGGFSDSITHTIKETAQPFIDSLSSYRRLPSASSKASVAG